jgi:hypothetical protein
LEIPSAYALDIFNGMIIFISRLSRSAERSKRIFTKKGYKENAVSNHDPQL